MEEIWQKAAKDIVIIQKLSELRHDIMVFNSTYSVNFSLLNLETPEGNDLIEVVEAI